MTELEVVTSAFWRGRRAEGLGAASGAAVVVLLGSLLAGAMDRSALLAVVSVLEVFGAVAFLGISGSRALGFVILGTLPLATALASTLVGHACTPTGCVSLCAPFCAVGGGAAGLLLSRMSWAARRPLVSWLTGAVLVVTTGSIGCACVGAAGVWGMLAGIVSSGVLWKVSALLSKR